MLLTLNAYWVILHAFLLSADFSQNQRFKNIISGKRLECQTVLFPDQAQYFVSLFSGLIWIQAVCII